MTHPLLDRGVVRAVERAATKHQGDAWTSVGFTDLNHRASHPCGIFAGRPFSVFAKLDRSPAGEEQSTAELNGFGLICSRPAPRSCRATVRLTPTSASAVGARPVG